MLIILYIYIYIYKCLRQSEWNILLGSANYWSIHLYIDDLYNLVHGMDVLSCDLNNHEAILTWDLNNHKAVLTWDLKTCLPLLLLAAFYI